MVYDFNYKELCIFQQIFEKIDVNTLSEEDSEIIKRFQDKMSNSIKEMKESIEFINKSEIDFEEQCKTGNFKYLCGVCKNGCRPRCFYLYQSKYCSAPFFGNCKNMIENPDYKK